MSEERRVAKGGARGSRSATEESECSRGTGGRSRGHFGASFGPTGFEEWGGYMNAKKQKLMEQFDEDVAKTANFPKQSDLFKGICIFVNGLTIPPAVELRQIMMKHGGTFHTYFVRDKTTHIIVSSMANSKQHQFDKFRVVRADWITESLSAGKLLDWRHYQFKSEIVKGQKSAEKFFMKTNNNEKGFEFDENDMQESETNDENESPMELEEGQQSEAANFQTINHSTMGQTVSLTTVSKPALNHNSTIGRPQDPNFLTEFFKNSRLHHISSLGAEWKEYVRKLQDDAPKQFLGRKNFETASTSNFDPSLIDKRIVMHIDMDCFFVSVGLRKRPELKGKPVAVTHSRSSGSVLARPGTDMAFERQHYEKKRDRPLKTKQVETTSDEIMEEGGSEEDIGDLPYDLQVQKNPSLSEMSTSEVASCSYEARAAGVKNGTFLGAAKKLCPSLITIPYDFEGYRQVSKLLYDIIASYTTHVEAVSCDECFVDLTEMVTESKLDPMSVASIIREDIRLKTECPASTGLGPNLLIARLATRLAKPDGQFYVTQDEVPHFIEQQPAKDLPGVGKAMISKLNKLNVTTCNDMQQLSLSLLQAEFGTKQGHSLHKLCRGQDDRPIEACKLRKSISVDVNYGIRFQNDKEPSDFIDKLAEEMEARMKGLGIKGKMVALKVLVRSKDAPVEAAKFGGHGIVDHLHKSTNLSHFTRYASDIAGECRQLLKQMHASEIRKVDARDIRGMGITLTKLDNQNTTPSGMTNIKDFLQQSKEARERDKLEKEKSVVPFTDSAGPSHCGTSVSTSGQRREKVPDPGASTSSASWPSEKEHLSKSEAREQNWEGAVPKLTKLDKNLLSGGLKPLIKDWLKSGDPAIEDVDFVCALLLSFIYKHSDLQLVFSICKMFLRRMATEEIPCCWTEALNVVIDIVQLVVEEEFGHPFLLT